MGRWGGKEMGRKIVALFSVFDMRFNFIKNGYKFGD
jgi:hypothetical protein